MPELKFDPAAMDEAAKIAMEDFKNTFPDEEKVSFARWWKKHYMKAGHKRLARGLLLYAPKKES